MSTTTEYLCPEQIVHMIMRRKLSLHALRVLHALLYCADKQPNGIAAGTLGVGPPPLVIATGMIPVLVGPVAANGLKSTKEGLEELSRTDLFKVFEHDTATNLLEFKFAPSVARLAVRAKRDAFAMIDLLDVQKCHTLHQLLFYTQMMVVANCQWPKFQLPGVGVGLDPWPGSVSQKWLRAAEKWSSEKNCCFLVVPHTEARTKRIESVRVKISHSTTNWSPGCFYLLTHRLLPTTVIAGVSQRTTRAILRQRHTWRYADKP